jgi:hypothetical protein
MTRSRLALAGALLLGAGAALLAQQGCGSSGLGTSIGTLGISNLVGIAAGGVPLSGATIHVVDKNGKTATGTANADGTYSVTVTGMTFPVLVEADDSAGTGQVYYSVSASGATTNADQFTSLIVTSYYAAQTTPITLTTTTFAAFSPTNAPSIVPTPSDIHTIQLVVIEIVGAFLQNQGITVTAFDLFQTPFDAGSGSGFDLILDGTTINSNGSVTINVSGTSTTVTPTASDGSITYATTTQSGTQTATANYGATVSTQSTQSDLNAAVNGVTAMLNQFGQQLNANSQNPQTATATSLVRFFDANYIDDSFSPLAEAIQFVNGGGPGAGVTTSIVSVGPVFTFDSANGLLQTPFTIQQSQNGVTAQQVVTSFHGESSSFGNGVVFKEQHDGSWRFFGNQIPVRLQALANDEINYSNGQNPQQSFQVQLDVQTAPGVLNSAQVTGPLPPNGTQTLTLTVTAQVNKGLLIDDWEPMQGGAETVSTFPPAGTQYTFNLGFPGPYVVTGSGLQYGPGPESFTVTTTATTTESVSIISYQCPNVDSGKTEDPATFGASATMAKLRGSTLTVNFTMPTTFTIAQINSNGGAFNTASNVQGSGDKANGSIVPNSGNGDGTGTSVFTIPSTASSGGGVGTTATAEFQMEIEFNGSAGQLIRLQDYFNQ